MNQGVPFVLYNISRYYSPVRIIIEQISINIEVSCMASRSISFVLAPCNPSWQCQCPSVSLFNIYSTAHESPTPNRAPITYWWSPSQPLSLLVSIYPCSHIRVYGLLQTHLVFLCSIPTLISRITSDKLPSRAMHNSLPYSLHLAASVAHISKIGSLSSHFRGRGDITQFLWTPSQKPRNKEDPRKVKAWNWASGVSAGECRIYSFCSGLIH